MTTITRIEKQCAALHLAIESRGMYYYEVAIWAASPTDVYLLYYCLKVIYHPLYGMNNYVLIWEDWLSCDPLRGSHDSQSPHIWDDWLSCDSQRVT